MSITCCFVREQYFLDHSHYVKMLDSGNAVKQSRRTHLCVQIKTDKNTFYIPLRNNLGADVRNFGRIGHAVPTCDRPNAGLDYRYALIINDPNYIEITVSQRIPKSQHQKILTDIAVIENEFEKYLSGFLKAARKNRILREPLYRESSLINFSKELGIPSCETNP